MLLEALPSMYVTRRLGEGVTRGERAKGEEHRAKTFISVVEQLVSYFLTRESRPSELKGRDSHAT